MRRRRIPEDLTAAVVAAWNAMPAHKKPALMIEHPDLYWAVARLAARENALRGGVR